MVLLEISGHTKKRLFDISKDMDKISGSELTYYLDQLLENPECRLSQCIDTEYEQEQATKESEQIARDQEDQEEFDFAMGVEDNESSESECQSVRFGT